MRRPQVRVSHLKSLLMRSTRSAVLIALALALCVSVEKREYALAQTAERPAPPILVESCRTGVATSDMLVKTDGNYQVQFVNIGTKTADSIGLVIHLNQQAIYVRDVGRFAPDAIIVHKYSNRGGEIVLVGEPTIECDIQWVHFVDGSVWRADPGPN